MTQGKHELSAAAGITTGGVSVPGRTVQRVHSTVEMEPGQTLVIGGLIQNLIQANVTMVPVLGEIPFLGTLFSLKHYAEDEQELVILVTPHLVDPQSCDQLAKLLPGQETRSPDDFELFLEQILEAPRGPREVQDAAMANVFAATVGVCYRTKDGRYIILLMLDNSDRDWRDLCEHLGRVVAHVRPAVDAD